MRINPSLEFLRAFFHFLFALLGCGGAPANQRRGNARVAGAADAG
jgi:hypothetical protein